MLDKICSIIAPHHCSVCQKRADGLCASCFVSLVIKDIKTCILCGVKLTSSRCNHCQLKGVRQQVFTKLCPSLRAVIHDYKYNSQRSLAKFFIQIVRRSKFSLNNASVLVPMPTNTHHVRIRGFDHTLNIVRHLKKYYHCEHKPILLRKSNFRQVGADRQTRFKQANLAFYCPTPLLTGVEYVIFRGKRHRY